MGCCVAVVGDLWEMVLYMMSRFCCHGYCIVKYLVSLLWRLCSLRLCCCCGYIVVLEIVLLLS